MFPLFVANRRIDFDPAIVFEASIRQVVRKLNRLLSKWTLPLVKCLIVIAYSWSNWYFLTGIHLPNLRADPAFRISTLINFVSVPMLAYKAFCVPENVNASVVRCRSNAVSLLNKCQALDTTAYQHLLSTHCYSVFENKDTLSVVGNTWPVGDIPFEPRTVPDFDRSVIRTRCKK